LYPVGFINETLMKPRLISIYFWLQTFLEYKIFHLHPPPEADYKDSPPGWGWSGCHHTPGVSCSLPHTPGWVGIVPLHYISDWSLATLLLTWLVCSHTLLLPHTILQFILVWLSLTYVIIITVSLANNSSLLMSWLKIYQVQMSYNKVTLKRRISDINHHYY